MKKLLILLFCAATLSASAQFTYDDIAAGRFAQRSVRGVRSMADGEHYTVLQGGNIVKYSYLTGAAVDTLVSVPGKFDGYVLSPDESKIITTIATHPIYRHSSTALNLVWDVKTHSFDPLYPAENVRDAAFSPDGSMIGYVLDNDIYFKVLDTADNRRVPREATRVTTDGAAGKIINGHTDWVYEEEFGFTRAFEFSPDSRHIAYLRFDETAVPEAAIMRFGSELYPTIDRFKYPKAGEPNSKVDLYIYSIESGAHTKVNTDTEYISRLGWTPDGRLYFYRTNRLQNHFELCTASLDGSVRVLYSECDERYVERPTDKLAVLWLQGGRFIVRSERDGYFHLYLNGVRALTKGRWEVTDMLDVVGDRVYFMSNEGSPLRNNLWSVRLNGRDKRRLTSDEGYFDIAPSRGFKYFISYFSNAVSPLQVRLHDATGAVVRVLEDNAAVRERIAEARVPIKRFFTCPADDGTPLNGWIMAPNGVGIDGEPAKYRDLEAKNLPVLMFQYSGPGSQQVLDQWSMDWYHVLVQHGYVVICVDGRGTGGRGAAFKKCTYGQLGALETADQIAVGRWVARQSWVDPARIGIHGWSFGGFMALNCMLKGADVFKMGIAVAPVTSWRFYDSVYTEIYNGLPSSNAVGYDSNSPLDFAARLRGKLLLVHGTADDNVHIQNTMRMAAALTATGRPFDMRIFPDDNHSMMPHGSHAVRQLMVDYTLKNL